MINKMKKILDWWVGGAIEREYIITLPNHEDCHIKIMIARPRLFWLGIVLIIIMFQIVAILI